MIMEHLVGTRENENEVFSRISHELRTPLTSIIGYAEVMLSDPRLSPDLKREYVEIIRDAGKRLSNFLDNYFDSSFAEHEQKARTRSDEDLSLIVKWSMDLVSADAVSKSVSVSLMRDEPVVLSNANTTHLVHILQNILTNAIHLAPRDGQVAIQVIQNPYAVEIRIINRDLGILNTSLSSVCQNFRWVQSPGVEIRENGLGLAFAKHVVELEGGELTVQTDHEQGLMFKIEFPNRSMSTTAHS
jgi:signal transduction histidine kinase